MEIKGLVAGPFNILLGLLIGSNIPEFSPILVAGLVGFIGYGISLVLFVRALRYLGAARTGAYFSTAPFHGALAAVFLLGEPITTQLAAAGALMAAGVWLHVTEYHEHGHVHEPIAHSHQHAHGADDPPGASHAHWHSHERLRHRHPHVPDMNHTHEH